MDEEDLFASGDEEESGPVIDGPNLFPYPQIQPRATRQRAPVWDPHKASGGRADLTGYMSIDQFFDQPVYKNGSLSEKQALEQEYRKRFLNKPTTMALGGNIDDLNDGMEYFKSRAVVDPRKDDSMFDTDWFDSAAAGLARTVGGTARVAGEFFDSDTLRDLAEKASADVKRIETENFSATTRVQREEESAADRRLAKEYGGKENIPWHRTIRQEFSNFLSQPVVKLAETVGTSLPVLLSAAAAGPAGAVAASSALVAGDAGGSAYDAVMALSDKALAASPAYKDLIDQGYDPVSAQQRLASEAALEGGAYGAVIGVISGGISAKLGAAAIVSKKYSGAALSAAERKVVETADTGILALLKSTGGEALSEFIEEGATQIAQNKAVQTVDPTQSLTEDALKAATAGALPGAALGAASHGLPSSGEANAPDPQLPGGTPPGSPDGTATTPDQGTPSEPETPETPPDGTPVDPVRPPDVTVPEGGADGNSGDAAPDSGSGGEPSGGSGPGNIDVPPAVDPATDATLKADYDRAVGYQAILDSPPGPERDAAMAEFPDRDLAERTLAEYQEQLIAATERIKDLRDVTSIAAVANSFAYKARAGVPAGGAFNRSLRAQFEGRLKAAAAAGQKAPQAVRDRILDGLARGVPVSSDGNRLFPEWSSKDFMGALAGQIVTDSDAADVAGYAIANSTPDQLQDFHAAVMHAAAPELRVVADMLSTAIQALPADQRREPDPGRALDKTPVTQAKSLRSKLFTALGRPDAPGPDIGVQVEPLSPVAEAAIRNGDVWTALRDIAVNSESKAHRLVAAKMLTLQNKVGIVVAAPPAKKAGLRAAAGLHYLTLKLFRSDYPNAKISGRPSQGVVVINPASGVNKHAFIHEVAHAYTVYSYYAADSAVQRKARQDIGAIRVAAIKQATAMGMFDPGSPQYATIGRYLKYGLMASKKDTVTSDVEFIAEAFSNPTFQAFLASVKDTTVKDGNLLTRFAKLVAKLFGIDNLFARSLIVIDNLTDEALNESILQRPTKSPGGPAGEGTETGGGDDQRETVRRGPDNSGVPSPDTSVSAVARAAGSAHGDGNPYTEGPPSARVADAVKALPDRERVELEAAGSTAGITGADLAQLLHDIAADRGAGAVVDSFDGLPVMQAAVRGLNLPQKVQGAIDKFTEQNGKIKTWDQMMDLVNQGKSPASDRFAGWTDRYIEKFIDSSQPFATMLRKSAWPLQNNPLWQAFKLAGSKYELQKVEINRDVRAVNETLTKLAKSIGMDPKDFFLLADMYTLAKYVATGANSELEAKHRAIIADLDAQIQVLMQQNTAASAAKISVLQDKMVPSQKWLQRYQAVNGVVRKPEGTMGSNGLPDPDARMESDQFVGGLTEAEAVAIMSGSKITANINAFEQAQAAIVGMRQKWASKAVVGRLFNPDEVAGWSQNPNYVPTTGDPRSEEEAAYETGGLASRDYARMGRAGFSDGGFMATVQQISGFARRLGYKDFYDQLAEEGRNSSNPYGITTMPEGKPSKGIAFATKQFDPSTGKTHYQKIVFDDQAAAGSILGMNRSLDESATLRALSDFTSIFGRAVTQYTLAFGPVNYVRDLGEKAFTLLSSIPGINKAKFISTIAREFANVRTLQAAWAYSSGRTLNTPEFIALKQLADNGGLNTRTGSLSRDVDRIVKEMRRTDGWRAIAHRVGEWVHNYNNMFEIAASVAVYRALGVSSGGTVEQQAFQILNTMNFGQSGTKSPIFRAFYTFFNPTAQGALNVARGIKSLKTAQGRGVLAGTALAYGLLYAIARAFGGDDDDDETGNRMDSLADGSLARVIPLFFGDDTMVKVPVPFGIQTALWSAIVAGGRLASGRFHPGEAAAFALQGAAEQMAPFPLSRVDITQNPSFWMAKSLTPQWGQLLLNIAADKNDFGGKLTRAFIQSDQPLSVQGKRDTPDAYKEFAAGLHSVTGVDLAPEQVQESLKYLALGPLGAAIEGFLKDEERSGVPMAVMVAQGATGSNRIVGLDTKEIDRRYYSKMERVYNLYKLGFSQSPRLTEDGKKEPLDDWLDRTSLDSDQRRLMVEFGEADRALKKARRAGATVAEEREIMRNFLRETRGIE